jgi:hypothetical protein
MVSVSVERRLPRAWRLFALMVTRGGVGGESCSCCCAQRWTKTPRMVRGALQVGGSLTGFYAGTHLRR